MNIVNTTNKCDLKCSFNFLYTETTILSLITPTQIMLKLGTPSIKPVKFNDITYTPVEASITYPSQTLYNGVTADAEFSIGHISDVDKPLFIRIPISTSSITKPSTLEDIINQTAALLPNTEPVALTIPSFTLEDYVPKGPFYYSDTGAFHEIYYGLDNSLFLSQETITKLKEIVITGGLKISRTNGELFYNSYGSNLANDGGQDFNFLECNEYYEEDVPVDSNNNPNIFQKLAMSPTAGAIFTYFIAFIIAGIILFFFYRALYFL